MAAIASASRAITARSSSTGLLPPRLQYELDGRIHDELVPVLIEAVLRGHAGLKPVTISTSVAVVEVVGEAAFV